MARIAEILEAVRHNVAQMPPDTNLGRQWQLCRRYQAGLSQIAEVLARLTAEGIVEYRTGPCGGYFTIAPDLRETPIPTSIYRHAT